MNHSNLLLCQSWLLWIQESWGGHLWQQDGHGCWKWTSKKITFCSKRNNCMLQISTRDYHIRDCIIASKIMISFKQHVPLKVHLQSFDEVVSWFSEPVSVNTSPWKYNVLPTTNPSNLVWWNYTSPTTSNKANLIVYLTIPFKLFFNS